MAQMIAGQALVRVLQEWGVNHVYGIPGGSINHTLEGLYLEKDAVQYIQVRHEETGAIAASADAKYTGKIGVCFGSAGPGATHLFNGLYDAKMDHVPVLALVGQVPSRNINTNYFQEMDEIPMFSDVSVYNRMVTTAEQIPYVINQAIRAAYEHKGVAVVVLPEDFTATEIDYEPTKTAPTWQQDYHQVIDGTDIATSLRLIKDATHPVLYVGRGLLGARDVVEAASERFSMPVITTVPATGTIRTDHPNSMGTFYRLGTKPSYEALRHSDLILFLGAQIPFARFFPKSAKVLQVNTNIYDIGKVVPADYAVIGDARTYLEALLEMADAEGYRTPDSTWLALNRINKRNWDAWLEKLATDDSKGLNPESVFKKIAEMVGPNDIYAVDTGNVSEWSVRGLPMTHNQRFAISGLFATMGFGVPAGIAGALDAGPDAQTWTLSGDGGFAMVAPDLLTQARYELPIINVVFTNNRFGFIYKEQIDTKQHLYGVDLTQADWAKTAEGLGAIGFTVSSIAETERVFNKITELQAQGNKRPIVVDAIIRPDDPIDTGVVTLDPVLDGEETVRAYAETYGIDVDAQPALGVMLRAQGDER
ncbi:MAG: thiamine pyrophosphate-dependent enzyme [Bifidobacteriaceae bacterium]|nr:thiamine pyrophosphate-dependent enzyme [Bifidobacteriaceae bacterium]